MSSALDELGELNADSLRRNRFCMGVKRDGEYVCGGEADENVKGKAVELLSEAIRRMQRWRVWETWWVDEIMDEWLEKRDRLEIQLRGKYGDDVVNDLLRMVNKFIDYNEKFLNYWHEVGNEVRKLIEDLMSGKAEVIIWESEKGVSVHGKFITLEVDRASNDSVTVQLKLNDLEGVTVKVPNVFKMVMNEEEYKKFKKVLKLLKGGLEEADGFIEKGYASMETTQMWQVIVWLLLCFGNKMYVHINSINANDYDVTTAWYLQSRCKALKGRILDKVRKLSMEELLAFMLGAILGDGSAGVFKTAKNGHVYDETVVKITMVDEEFKKWELLLERLKKMGFNWGKPVQTSDDVIAVRFYGSNAINLARALINVLPPILRDILDALGFEKWERTKRIAGMEVKFRRGEAQISIANHGFTINVQKSTVVLVHKVKDDAEVNEVINALKAMYGDEFAKHVRVNKSGEYQVVKIPMRIFMRYEDIKRKVIEVLCRKLERTKDEEKRQIIARQLRRLAPTKGAAAAKNYPCAGVSV